MSKDNGKWDDIIGSGGFSVIVEYFENRKTILTKELKELGNSPSPTNLNKISQNLAGIREVDAFLARVNFQRSQTSTGRK